MIHPPRVVARIIDLLNLSGVSSDAIIEELRDHYLTQIEVAISHGTIEQKAIRETYQVIASTNFNAIDQKVSQKRKWILSSLVLGLMLIFIISHCKKSSKTITPLESTALVNVPDGWPINSKTEQITSGFGLRMHPVSKTKRFHKGIDIQAIIGTPVVSTGNGKIKDAGYSSCSGHYILIKHNAQYSTRYAHLSKIDVTYSQSVAKGDTIGFVGNSGISLAPHLHYEVIKNETVVDPMHVIAP
ncbi:MAG: murein DD-endopeptidase MepM/ murein hydrolase activator NlpD [Saprospiraceae bacterium]|jgi:murein DD-endopeptidase MepM/ murein hydrolase activator NlpD